MSQCQAPIFVSAEEWVYGLAQLIPPEISPTSRFRNHPYPTFLVIPGWIWRIFWKCDVGRGSYAHTSIDISTCSQLKLVMQHHPGIHPNTTFLSKIELLKSYIRIPANLQAYQDDHWALEHYSHILPIWELVRTSTSTRKAETKKALASWPCSAERNGKPSSLCWSMKFKLIEASTTVNSKTQTHSNTHTMQTWCNMQGFVDGNKTTTLNHPGVGRYIWYMSDFGQESVRGLHLDAVQVRGWIMWNLVYIL